MKNASIINKIVDAIRKNNLSVFVGAGLSKSAGFPDWKELVNEIVNELGLDVKKETDMISLVQYAYNSKRKNRNYINELIKNTFLDDSKSSINMNILASLPIRSVWTTNYDLLIENSLRRLNKIVDVKKNQDDLSNNLNNSDVVLYKMHGDAQIPSEAVLTRDDFEEFSNKRGLFVDKLIGELVSSTFLFIGYSFNDPNFEKLLARIRVNLQNNNRTHYYFVKKVNRADCIDDSDYEYQKIKQKLQIEDLEYYSLEAIIIDDYTDITDFLNEVSYKLRENNVFISGSAYDYGEWEINQVRNLVQNLSERLVENGNKIISGYGLGIGGFVIEGASKAIDATTQNISEYFEIYPFPQKINGYRKRIIGLANYAIFIFGNKFSDGKIERANGVFNEYKIAKELGLKIIPIASTGFVAKEIMDIVMSDTNEYPYLINSIDILLKDTDQESIINEIIKIIKSEV
jgi:hypothetical protein